MGIKGPSLATELFPNGSAPEAVKLGRQLILEFAGDVPVLQRIEYTPQQGLSPSFWQQGHHLYGFTWSEVPQALSLLFLDYLIWDRAGRSGKFYFSGHCKNSPAASLGDAIYSSGPIRELFVSVQDPNKESRKHILRIFNGGDNMSGAATIERERRIAINPIFLPPECVQIFHGKNPLNSLPKLQACADRLRDSLGLPPVVPPAIPGAEASREKAPTQAATPTSPKRGKSGSAAETKSHTLKEEKAKPAPVRKGPPPVPAFKPEDFPEFDHRRAEIYGKLYAGLKPSDIFDSDLMRDAKSTLERATQYCNAVINSVHSVDGTLRPELFMDVPTDYTWPNNMPVWSAGDGDSWTLDDVTQGTLILGATGSGKTTASGRTIAQALLAKQFGGLVLTTKPGEAREWIILCNAMGRAGDLRWVRHDGPLRLNLLAYETQRPGAGALMSENLVGFFRVLISVLGYRHGQRTNEGFWQSTGNQILRNLFETFMMSRSPMTLDRIADFVTAAPRKVVDDDESWREIPLFGEVLEAAENNANNPAEWRQWEKVKHYWLRHYPGIPNETRGCIDIAFYAMLDVLRSRYIYELLSTHTTIIPDCVFQGNIVLLDLPVKEFGDAGVLVQTAFKYLFQRTVERRQKLNEDSRPVFLFVDEAQNFFAENDVGFQQTARSSRVATVLLSQNINNFYAQLGGDKNAQYLFDSLAGNLNTRIFHANGDMLTNEWASKMFGTWEKPVSSFSTTTQPQHSLNPLEVNPPTFGHGMSTRREAMVFPEDFAKLRSGNETNNFQSDAYVYRVGTVFKQTGLPFIKTVFGQTKITETPN